MAKIYLWNSIAYRRRSISDTFYENGLATIKSMVESRGHKAVVVDFANNQYYLKLSPGWLVLTLRKLYKIIFQSPSSFQKHVLQIIALVLQKLLNFFQKRYLKKELDKLISAIKKDNTKLLGIKVWYGDAFRNANYLAKRIKKKIPDIIVISGGYHVTLYEEQLIKESQFDLGIAGPGSNAINSILSIADKYADKWDKTAVLNEFRKRAQQGDLGTVFFKENGQIEKFTGNHIGNSNSESLRYEINPDKVKVHVLVESSGCPWGKCNFCVHNYFNKENQQRNMDEIMGEIRSMKSQGIGLFRFAGSDTPPHFGAKIAERLISENIQIIYSMGSRAIKFAKNNYADLLANYEVMLHSGLRAIFMGGECGNDQVNKEIMNKGITSEDIYYTVKAFREAEKNTGIKAFLLLALIYPPPLPPHINLQQVEDDNLALLRKTMPDSVMISPPAPFIHSRWFEESEKFGFDLEPDFISKIMKYEYVLYKPPKMWPKLDINLNGKPFVEILAECSVFRNKVQNILGIPTDVADEHILMFIAAGLTDPKQIMQARMETMLDIISCDYTYTLKLSEKVNAYSEKIAAL